MPKGIGYKGSKRKTKVKTKVKKRVAKAKTAKELNGVKKFTVKG